jgi:hypothetical protein
VIFGVIFKGTIEAAVSRILVTMEANGAWNQFHLTMTCHQMLTIAQLHVGFT